MLVGLVAEPPGYSSRRTLGWVQSLGIWALGFRDLGFRRLFGDLGHKFEDVDV